MSLKAGRVGVNPVDVDPINGKINPSSIEGYTKTQADAKFATKEALAASQTTTLSLLKDTVGWVGIQKITYPYGDDYVSYPRGITFSVNSNGTVNANGTNDGTDNSEFYLSRREGTAGNKIYLEAGHYKVYIADNPDMTPNSNIDMSVGCTKNGSYYSLADTSSNNDFTLTERTAVQLGVRIAKNATVTDAIIYPLICDASIPNPTWHEYHPTVSELLIQLTTDMLTGSQLKAVVADSSDFADFKTKVAEM